MTDVSLTAALDEIRGRYSLTNYSLATESPHAHRVAVASTSDVPRLLAAVEAVLELHHPGRVVVTGSLCKRHEAYAYFSITRTEADEARGCPDCKATIYNSCAGCDHNPWLSVDECPARSAISRALLEEGGDR